MYFCEDINRLIISYVQSYTDANKFFRELAAWLERTVDIEYGIFGNLDKVYFDIEIRSEPVMPNTFQVLPWEPLINVLWNGDIGKAVVKIKWIDRVTYGRDYEITQTISESFDFELLWPRGVPVVPTYMFDMGAYFMGPTEWIFERFTDPSDHDLDIVPRMYGSRMVNATACAKWLELR